MLLKVTHPRAMRCIVAVDIHQWFLFDPLIFLYFSTKLSLCLLSTEWINVEILMYKWKSRAKDSPTFFYIVRFFFSLYTLCKGNYCNNNNNNFMVASFSVAVIRLEKSHLERWKRFRFTRTINNTTFSQFLQLLLSLDDYFCECEIEKFHLQRFFLYCALTKENNKLDLLCFSMNRQ